LWRVAQDKPFPRRSAEQTLELIKDWSKGIAIESTKVAALASTPVPPTDLKFLAATEVELGRQRRFYQTVAQRARLRSGTRAHSAAFDSVLLAWEDWQIAREGAKGIHEQSGDFGNAITASMKKNEEVHEEAKNIHNRWTLAWAVFFTSALVLQVLVGYAYPDLVRKKRRQRSNRPKQAGSNWLRRAASLRRGGPSKTSNEPSL
jgi:hypothetical protein